MDLDRWRLTALRYTPPLLAVALSLAASGDGPLAWLLPLLAAAGGGVVEGLDPSLERAGPLWPALLLLVGAGGAVIGSLQGPARRLRAAFALALLAAVFTVGARLLHLQGTGGLRQAVVILSAVFAVCVVALRPPGAARPGPVDGGRAGHGRLADALLGGLALAVGAALALQGLDRDVGSNFFAHWQDWDALARPLDVAELSRITTGTARTSMDSGPYRLLAHAALVVGGPSWAALRGLSALCFVGALVVAERFLARRLSAPAAAGGVLLLAGSPLLLDLGHVPSFLGPSLLLAVATIAAYGRWLDSDGARGGVLLGALLFADLYGFAPLRLLLAFAPLAGMLVLARGTVPAWRAFGVPAAVAIVPTIAALLLSGSAPIELVYADGEFAPFAHAGAAEGRFRIVEPDAARVDVLGAAREIGLLTFAGWWSGPNLDDGVAPPMTVIHTALLALGLLALVFRGVWRGRGGTLLGWLLLLQLPVLTLMYPPVIRRMGVYVPILAMVGAGGLELLLRGGRDPGRPLPAAVAALVLVGLAGALLPLTVAHLPGLVAAPDPVEIADSPCRHQRLLADRARADGRALLWIEADDDPPAAWGWCHEDVVGANWRFQRWRACASSAPATDRIGRLAQEPRAGHDALTPQRLRARVADLSVERVGIDAPVYRFGEGRFVLVIDPASAVGAALLDDIRAAPGFTRCD